MIAIIYQLNILLPVLYGITSFSYIMHFINGETRFRVHSRMLLLFTAASHLTYLVLKMIGENHIPLASQGEAFSFFAAALALVYIYLEIRLKSSTIGAFIIIIAWLFQLLSTLRYSGFTQIKPVLQSAWFALHAGSAVLSFAAFAVAALLSLLYLLLFREIRGRKPGYIFQRIPSLEILDEMSYKAVTLGFLLLTMGIGSGAIWADQAWGKFWSWDPKQVSSLVVWLIYAAYLHARLQKGWEGKRVALFAAFGFCSLVFTFVFVDLLFKTAHQFI